MKHGSPKTVLEVVKEYLATHGYDGLCTEGCGCSVDDLAPCGGEGIASCVVAKSVPVEDAKKYLSPDENWLWEDGVDEIFVPAGDEQ